MVEMIATLWAGSTAALAAAEVYHRRKIQSLEHRILVSGMRGKSTAVKLLHACFREAGSQAYSRTSGDEVLHLLPDGSERLKKRWGTANIREMRSTMRKATALHCDTVCVENMAIIPEYSKLSSTHIVKPTLLFHCFDGTDHTEFYPTNTVERTRMIIKTWPSNVPVLIIKSIRNEVLIDEAKKANFEVITPEPLNSITLRPHISEIAGAVAGGFEYLTGQQPDQEQLEKLASKHQYFNTYIINDRPIIDLRSSNDPESTSEALNILRPEKDLNDFTLVYLHRDNRPGRLFSFEQLLQKYPSIISGDILPLSYTKKNNFRYIKKPDNILKEFDGPLVLAGNRHGSAETFFDKLFSGVSPEQW